MPDAAAVIPEQEPPEDVVEEEWHRVYLRAWRVLRYDRPYGAFGGEGTIPFTAINEYGRRYGFEGDDFDVLLGAVRALDSEWLEFVADERAKDPPG